MSTPVVKASFARATGSPVGQTPAARVKPSHAARCTRAEAAPTERWNRAAHASVAAMTLGLSPVSLALAVLDWWAHLMVAPGTCFELATHACLLVGGSPDEPDTVRDEAARGITVHAGQADPRFAESSWASWPFRIYRDVFLSTQRWWHDATHGVPGVERHHEELVGFAARQWLDACSPCNFLLTNPVVLEATLRSGGANLAAGACTGSTI